MPGLSEGVPVAGQGCHVLGLQGAAGRRLVLALGRGRTGAAEVGGHAPPVVGLPAPARVRSVAFWEQPHRVAPTPGCPFGTWSGRREVLMSSLQPRWPGRSRRGWDESRCDPPGGRSPRALRGAGGRGVSIGESAARSAIGEAAESCSTRCDRAGCHPDRHQRPVSPPLSTALRPGSKSRGLWRCWAARARGETLEVSPLIRGGGPCANTIPPVLLPLALGCTQTTRDCPSLYDALPAVFPSSDRRRKESRSENGPIRGQVTTKGIFCSGWSRLSLQVRRCGGGLHGR